MVFQTKILQCQNTQVYVEGWHYLLTLSVSVYCFFIVLSIFYYLLYSTCLKQPLKQQKTSMGRISHRRCSVKNGVLGNFAKFTGEHLCQILFFNKKACNFSKKSLWHRRFPVNLGNFQEHFFCRAHPDDCFCLTTKTFLRVAIL